MNAIHINCTRPFRDKEYFIEDFEILTTVLSAQKWREHNGRISMITDSVGYRFYAENGLLNVWDEVRCDLDSMPSVNDEMFWAAGKIWALKNYGAPVAMLDTDFIVWAPLAFSNLSDAAVIHFEELYTDVYPGKDYFKMKDGYTFRKDFDWLLPAANTAFCVLQDRELIEFYTNEAWKFIENAKDCDDTLSYMVFAEQRLLPMCAKIKNVNLQAISGMDRLFRDGEKYFTHIWGMKQQMREDDALRYDFCMRCIERIKTDFPHMIDILKEIQCLKRYFI